MKKSILAILLLIFSFSSAFGQIWSAVGNGLSPNIVRVNSFYVNSINRLVICNTSKVTPDSIPVWNDTTYIFPWDTLPSFVSCDFVNSFVHDSITYCATEFRHNTHFGTLLGDLMPFAASYSEYFTSPVDPGCPPITNAIAGLNNEYHSWYISGNGFYYYDNAIGYGTTPPVATITHCLLMHDSVLYIGGRIGGSNYPVAIIDSNSTFSTIPTFPYTNSITKTTGSVWAMTFHDGKLFVGGDFPGHIASWNDTLGNWDTIPGITGTIYALQSYNGKLYAGGNAQSVYVYNDTLVKVAGTIPLGDSITCMAVYDSSLYIGGHFKNVNSILHTGNFAKLTTPYFKPSKCSGLVAAFTTLSPDKCGYAGQITVSVSGGIKPFKYSWSPNGGTNATADSLIAGKYTVTITDSNGCIAKNTTTLIEPLPFKETVCSTSNVSCSGYNDGCIIICDTGGTFPYTYQWENGMTTNKACYLSAGTYQCTSVDSNGCFAIALATLSQPPLLVTHISSTPPTCSTCCNGSATGTVSGGTPPYNDYWGFNWNNGQTDFKDSDLCTGTYSFCVTDANGCQSCDSVTLSIITSVLQNSIYNSNCTVYPNPSNGKFTIQSSVVSGQSIVEIYNVLGEKIYSQYSLPNTQYQIDLSKEQSGIYFYRVTTEKGELIGNGKLIVQ